MLGVRVTRGITRRGANFVSTNDSLAENRRVTEYRQASIFQAALSRESNLLPRLSVYRRRSALRNQSGLFSANAEFT